MIFCWVADMVGDTVREAIMRCCKKYRPIKAATNRA